MFDRTTIHQSPSHVEHVHTEHKAPTDESIRILDEFHQRAAERVREQIALQFDNALQLAVVLETPWRTACGSAGIRLCFSINGKPFSIPVPLGKCGLALNTREVALAAFEAIARAIAAELSKEPAFGSLLRSIESLLSGPAYEGDKE